MAALYGDTHPYGRSITGTAASVAPRPASRRLVTVAMMNKSQAEITYGFPSIARSDRSYFTFMLMNKVLGQYALGGRIGDSIRERQGMAHSVWNSFDASTDDELQSLRRLGVTGREMAESRQYISGSMPRLLETSAGIAGSLQNADFFGLGLDYDRRLPILIMMVTIDDVNAAAAALDPAHVTVVVAGPYQP